jgi:4-hydroxybenzoate polyprenyltransferase
VVGYALGASSLQDFFRLEYFVFLLYFFLPANILIYGVNDYFDRDTDALNPKKDGMEHRVAESERDVLARAIRAVLVISAALMLMLDLTAALLFLGFLLLSYFYSAPPLRFKGRPFLDFSSNMLYIMPGVLAYYLASGDLPSIWLVAAGFLHIAAMHLFSAIPDIQCDRQAGVITTAVLIGKRASLLLCLLLWSGLAALALVLSGFHYLSFLALLYPAVPLSLLAFRSWRIERVYWYLPYLNTILGGMLFTVLVLLLALG